MEQTDVVLSPEESVTETSVIQPKTRPRLFGQLKRPNVSENA